MRAEATSVRFRLRSARGHFGGMVGVYGHNDRPNHSFALVPVDGTIAWVRHYAEMFVPSDVFFDELDIALGP